MHDAFWDPSIVIFRSFPSSSLCPRCNAKALFLSHHSFCFSVNKSSTSLCVFFASPWPCNLNLKLESISNTTTTRKFHSTSAFPLIVSHFSKTCSHATISNTKWSNVWPQDGSHLQNTYSLNLSFFSSSKSHSSRFQFISLTSKSRSPFFDDTRWWSFMMMSSHWEWSIDIQFEPSKLTLDHDILNFSLFLFL